mgnify:CR=1 FL=1
MEENITEAEEVGVLADVLWLEHIQHSIDGTGDLAFLCDPLEEWCVCIDEIVRYEFHKGELEAVLVGKAEYLDRREDGVRLLVEGVFGLEEAVGYQALAGEDVSGRDPLKWVVVAILSRNSISSWKWEKITEIMKWDHYLIFVPSFVEITDLLLFPFWWNLSFSPEKK